jgi:hypothetical protein
MMKIFYTYLWLREDGTPYYVGKGCKDRAYVRHRVGKPPSKECILLQEHPSEEAAFEAEKFFISYYGRKDLGTGCLRNLSDGGEGISGLVVTAEQRKKQSEAAKKRWSDPKQRQQLVDAHIGQKGWNTGIKTPPQVCKKLSEIHTGVKLSDSHREGISRGLKGNQYTKGHRLSEEHKAKLSAVRTGHRGWNKGKRWSVSEVARANIKAGAIKREAMKRVKVS